MKSTPLEPSISTLLLAAARQDLAAAKLLSNAAEIGDALVGFHLQQATEKSLKAVLSARGIEFRRTHDLLWLVDLLAEKGLPAPPHAEWLDELNPYAVEARYGTIEPDGLSRVIALQSVTEVVQWAAQQTLRP